MASGGVPEKQQTEVPVLSQSNSNYHPEETPPSIITNQDSCETVTLKSSSSQVNVNLLPVSFESPSSGLSDADSMEAYRPDSDISSDSDSVEDVRDLIKPPKLTSAHSRNKRANVSAESEDLTNLSPASRTAAMLIQPMASSINPSDYLLSASAPASEVSRPVTLGVKSGDASASARSYKHKTITKKESYSSLSEFSSRSSSIDQLLQAATSTPLCIHGTVDVDGGMITFVADGINEMIKRGKEASGSMSRSSSLSSSTSGWSALSTSVYSRNTRSPSVLTGSPDEVPPIDPRALLDLEIYAHRVSDSVGALLQSLTTRLHRMSTATTQCVDVYRDSVDSTCDCVDASIKSMYALMAKCEELTTSSKPLYQIRDQIKEINRLLDLFESQLAFDET